MPYVSNEKKNLYRLAGEFLVASRFTQRGYMVSLQWGTTIGYDILVFDKKGQVAFLEVKTSASHPKDWALQIKFAKPREDAIPESKRFVACVDMTQKDAEPFVYLFPAKVVADGLKYYFNNRFPNSPILHLPLDKKPQGRQRETDTKTVGEYINADDYREKFDITGISPIER